MISVDVVILGGGLQGLLLLRELTAARYSCVLVTNAHLGIGQTLHSHGLLNSGTGLLTGTLQEELHTSTLPYLRRLNVPVYGDDRSFLLAPAAMLDQLSPVWEANGYHPHPTDASALPRGFEPGGSTYRVRGFNVDKRRLVEAVADGLEHLVLQGEVVGADDRISVRTTRSRELVHIEPRAVVVAAGCGTKRLLGEVFGTDEPALSRIGYTKPHMICVRGPADLLPPIGTVLSPEVIVVGHRYPRGRKPEEHLVTWYVTPATTSPERHADAADDGTAPVEPSVVAAGIAALVRLFPPLESAGDRVEASVFAGFKQDLDGVPTRRACEVIDSERNLLMVLPSVLANAVPNAVDAVSIVRERLQEPSLGDADIGSLGGAVVGELNEDTAHARWSSWGEFTLEYTAWR